MRSVFRQNSFLAGLALGVLLAVIGAPLWKLVVMRIGQDRFAELTFACDNAMRGHLLAKQRLVGSPSKVNADAVKAAEIGLLDCQDYDLMQKRLIRWGLTENELSELSLMAIEAKGDDLRDVIRIYEIRY